MPHDIENVRTIIPRQIWRSQKRRTTDDYQADMIRRFGKLPTLEELAWMENGKLCANREQLGSSDPCNIEAAIAASRAGGEVTSRAVLAVMKKPMTAQDVATALKTTRQATVYYLKALADAGKIKSCKVKSVTVWERVQQ